MPAFQKESIHFPSADGTSQTAGYFYTPTQPIRAVIQLSHGMCEYAGRYEALARELCGRGIVFCGNDHLGHGATALLNREKLGYFGPRGSRKFLVEDLELLLS